MNGHVFQSKGKEMTSRLATILAALTMCACLTGNSAVAEEPKNALMDAGSYWRTFLVVRPPVVRDGQQLRKLVTLTSDAQPLPSADWISPTFDDSMWARIPGRTFPAVEKIFGVDESVYEAGICFYEHSSPALAALCLRGKVQVTSPGDMKLSVKYRGGVIVYANGKEVGRANLGKDGQGLEAVAEDYPKSAFITSDGLLLSVESAKKNATEVIAGWKARARSADITIPASALKNGVNVICIEVHRSPQIPEVESGVKKMSGQVDMPRALWATCGFLGATLTSNGGAVPNRSRPKGLQVWNSQLMNPDFDMDYGDPCEPIQPIRITGARKGSFSGKVVIGSDQAIKGLKAQVSDLAGEKGKIPASAVRVRYAGSSGSQPLYVGRYPVSSDLLDTLYDSAPATVEVRTKTGNRAAEWTYGSVMPVWVTALMPPDTQPGTYKGKLTLSADGVSPVNVPIEVKVSNYLLPSPDNFRTVVDLMQSPESVAMYYKVPLYGDQHFKYLEKSFDCLGYVGNWTVHIPLIARTNLGNEQTMVRWIKQADGSYKFDFSVMDRYLDTAIQHMGKPRMVALWVYDMFLGHEGGGHPQMEAVFSKIPESAKKITVSALDESTKAVSSIDVGLYNASTKPTWKALIGELMAHLKQRGLDQTVLVGAGNDVWATPEIIKFWKELLPNAGWVRYCHMAVDSLGSEKGEIDLQAYCITFRYMADAFAGKYSCMGWKKPDHSGGILYLRAGGPANMRLPLDMARIMPAMSVIGGWRGFGRAGLDYWPVLANEKAAVGRAAGVIHGRYPESFWRQLEMQIEAYSTPGPDGALMTGQLELTREGLQEAEARILLESSIDSKKVSGALTQKCQTVLDDHARGILPVMEVEGVAGYGQDRYARANEKYAAWLDGFNNNGYHLDEAGIFRRQYMASGWQERSMRLFDMAGEISGGK